MEQNRCRDCGGLWRRREHQTWCRHSTMPKPQTFSSCSTPEAMDIYGRCWKVESTYPLPTLSFGSQYQHDRIDL